ncbi:MAG: hypothetical protein JNK84_02215 [Phreatobacter sp.]|uniref:hypothetical protein n=1 Tax=Phreatobacter sp. TaxID=1966341 RepID=UPI001A4A9835|nr:hypothetical protein [Phreatobacter sp.]MBL8567876.1 hypothetical protein [Phreatobacter sp.]
MTMPSSAMPAGAVPQQAAYPAAATPVTVTAIDMPFFRLVGFFFKAALAAIPAMIAVALVVKVLAGIVFWTVGGWRYGMWM